MGGGTAGCPLAATLSQKFNVLLLERGGVPFANANVSLMQNFHISLADTSPHSASQIFASTDGVFNARARVLGGGTCINAGFYSRASQRFAICTYLTLILKINFYVFLQFSFQLNLKCIVYHDIRVSIVRSNFYLPIILGLGHDLWPDRSNCHIQFEITKK